MKDVQAQQDYRTNIYDSEYGMDNDYKDRYGKDSYESQYSSYVKDNYKSKDSNKIVKKINCNNVNVNVNGLELNLTSAPFLSNLLASESNKDREKGTGSYGIGERRYDRRQHSDSGKDFKFICINNNNNTVVIGNEPTPVQPEPEPLTCEECFTENLTVEQLTNVLSVLSAGNYTNLEVLCEFTLSNPTVFNETKLFLISNIFSRAGIPDEDTTRVLECLERL